MLRNAPRDLGIHHGGLVDGRAGGFHYGSIAVAREFRSNTSCLRHHCGSHVEVARRDASMKTIDRAGIEKRCQIAAAKAADRGATYKQLQVRFCVGPRVVADALKRSAGEWKAVLAVRPGASSLRWEYLVVKVMRQQAGTGRQVTVKQKVEGEMSMRDVAAGTVQAVLDEHGTAGWELVSSMLVGQDEGAGKWLYELHFKREGGLERKL
jgi:hypothetical protein